MDAEGDAVCLEVCVTADIVGCIPAEHDWEDLSKRHGVVVDPALKANGV